MRTFYKLGMICLMVVVLGGCFSPKTVREFADKKKLHFGVSVQAADVLDPATIDLVTENFNIIIPENTLKWANIRPNKTFWNWSDMDNIVAFAQKHKIIVKGHTFVWHQQNAPFVNALKTREDAIEVLEEQITEVMTRYKGKIAEYDVANEVLEEDGTMRNTIWLKTIGDDYLDIAFKAARKADPKAKLILNDYNNENMGNTKADAFYELVKSLIERNVPIDGVGFQMHLMAMHPVQEEAVRANVARFRELGLTVSFSEIDVRVKLPMTPEKEAEQIDVYTKLMEIVLTEPNVDSFIMWGYTDKMSWIPQFFPGFGFAHLYDRDVQPKPVYEVIKKMIVEP